MHLRSEKRTPHHFPNEHSRRSAKQEEAPENAASRRLLPPFTQSVSTHAGYRHFSVTHTHTTERTSSALHAHSTSVRRFLFFLPTFFLLSFVLFFFFVVVLRQTVSNTYPAAASRSSRFEKRWSVVWCARRRHRGFLKSGVPIFFSGVVDNDLFIAFFFLFFLLPLFVFHYHHHHPTPLNS